MVSYKFIILLFVICLIIIYSNYYKNFNDNKITNIFSNKKNKIINKTFVIDNDILHNYLQIGMFNLNREIANI